MDFHRHILDIDPEVESTRIADMMYDTLIRRFRRRGAVVGVSGGIDSATVLALAVRALGADRVVAVAMPERESEDKSGELAQQLASQFGVKLLKEDLTPILTGAGCYEKRDEAVRRVYPDYDPQTERIRLALPDDLLNNNSLSIFSLVRTDAAGNEERKLVPTAAFNQIMAASNMKQRTRMMTLYYHAERLRYGVAGTANKDEHMQGFFVKYGDGGVDLQPIQHLYKVQVYQIAAHLGVPQGIVQRTPTTDTYSGGGSQEEFFFRLPFELMDLIWYGLEHGVSAETVAQTAGLTTNQVENVYRELAQKERTTAYLRQAPVGLSAPAPFPV